MARQVQRAVRIVSTSVDAAADQHTRPAGDHIQRQRQSSISLQGDRRFSAFTYLLN